MVVDGRSEGQGTAVLCSAGIDSAVLLAWEARHQRVVPIYVSVGFAWEAAEQSCLDVLLRAPVYASRVAPLVRLQLPMLDLYPPSHWAVRGAPPAYDTPDSAVYLAGRNVVLLAKAAVLCEQHGLGRLALGTLRGNPFPDATPEFFSSFAGGLSTGLAHDLTIVAPFGTYGKAEVVRLGASLDVPLERTLSCMRPSDGHHCGLCSKCRERRDAFFEAGVPDPTSYASPSPRRASAR